MAVKRLKPQTHTLLVPEGLYALPSPILLYQKTTATVWANPAFEKEFGRATAGRFVPKGHLHLIREKPISLTVLSQAGRHEGFVIETVRGDKTPIELKITHYGDPAEECFIAMIEDVTPKVELEKQLIQNHVELQKAFSELTQAQSALVQSAKLASLGELSSGIAHELNQPLQAIMGFSQELQHLEKLSPAGSEFVADIVGASKKMAEIIRGLRNFARESGEALEQIGVESSVEAAIKLMQHNLMQSGVSVKFQAETGLPFITGNSIQLEQVIINLLSNARDAIVQAERKNGQIEVTLKRKGPFVELVVSDNGCGMTPEVQQKMFDPFFTTKEVGKGTGLGLSISFGILKRFNAETQIQSEVGKGTKFKITFNTVLNNTGSTNKRGEIA
ncbi:MAG: hypothetical protein JST80_03575 [Bdellovibrionales bacterium]|nr:hypothetical protein [Bdellovibrionales bacterium]